MRPSGARLTTGLQQRRPGLERTLVLCHRRMFSSSPARHVTSVSRTVELPRVQWGCQPRRLFRDDRGPREEEPSKGWWNEQKQSFGKTKQVLRNTPIVWKPIPIGLGIACLAAIQYLHMRRREDQSAADPDHPVVTLEGPWQVHVYAALPLRAVSRLWGWANNLTVPVWLRGPFYRAYASYFGCNLDEMEDPNLEHYANLSQFFYRPLKPGARPIDNDALLVSPADGKVLHFGLITQQRTVEQIKGVTYSLDALLGRQKQLEEAKAVVPINEEERAKTLKLAEKSHSQEIVAHDKFGNINDIDYSLDKMLGHSQQSVTDEDNSVVPAKPTTNAITQSTRPGNALFFAVIYLAPGDYHRFHSPTDWVVRARRHFSGELYSVSPLAVTAIKNLFVLNERVVLMGEWAHGFFSYIPVGATNVGSIKIDFDPDLKTNLRKRQIKHAPGKYDELQYGGNGVQLAKGQQMGGFELGSTVVLVFEAPTNFEFTLEGGQKVKVGEPMGRIRE
ncbi:phosphatidylserine decarboxylase-domain-containing protein [Fimicolochytrium jonesii]|uniref:phosphatidylserine decarboxylase-domain-containing protein n=1 Tax=Fimicolochytrium jonesii TaxID=1396493 RepID=UPI0022FF406F|nr:phosphatidylserine decarboxylase-domain-containing protein [Fimicolochytrium jonesii]KAI8822097.1 phosphatidylserine decarboxylase-domain-containing protein [Fimicolochytrium jonesii]